MSQNDSHIVVHNHIEGFSNIQILTIVFFVVITFIIVLLLIIAIVILIVVVLRKKNPMKLSDHTSKETLRESTLQTVPKTMNGESFSGTGAVNLAALLNDDDDDTGINSNSQNIPLSVLRSRLNDHFCESPESTPSVYENLYPSQHEGEIVSGFQPNTNFARRVKRKTTLPKSGTATSRPERKPSSARERQSSSLEWDYFESRPYFEPKSSDSSDGSERADKNTVDVCWV